MPRFYHELHTYSCYGHYTFFGHSTSLKNKSPWNEYQRFLMVQSYFSMTYILLRLENTRNYNYSSLFSFEK